MNDTLIKFGPEVSLQSYGGQGLSDGAKAVLASMFLSEQVSGLSYSAADQGQKNAITFDADAALRQLQAASAQR